MRLLITTDTVGGVWTFTTELTQQLLQRGHSVHLVSFGRQPSPDQQAWVDHLAKGRHPAQSGGSPLWAPETEARTAEPISFTFTPTDIPLEWMQDNERAFEEGQTDLLEALQHHPADLILSNQFCFGRLNTPIPRIVIAHSDVLSWARACKPAALEPSPWLNRYTSMVQAGLLDAAAVTAPTGWMGKALITNFFLPRNYFVIPNGVSVEPTADPSAERTLQAITAGRLWDEAKGIDTLRDLQSPIPLLVAGDSTFDTAQPESAWPEHLTNLGPLSRADLHLRFRQSAIYLCPSRYEPFGLAPLEAALCGCAIVARDLPSLREVWGDSATYFHDNASLTGILQSLAKDRFLLFHFQGSARQRATELTPTRMADSYLHLCQTVLQQQATPHVP